MSNIEQETKIGLEHIRKVYPEKRKKENRPENESCLTTFLWI